MGGREGGQVAHQQGVFTMSEGHCGKDKLDPPIEAHAFQVQRHGAYVLELDEFGQARASRMIHDLGDAQAFCQGQYGGKGIAWGFAYRGTKLQPENHIATGAIILVHRNRNHVAPILQELPGNREGAFARGIALRGNGKGRVGNRSGRHAQAINLQPVQVDYGSIIGKKIILPLGNIDVSTEIKGVAKIVGRRRVEIDFRSGRTVQCSRFSIQQGGTTRPGKIVVGRGDPGRAEVNIALLVGPYRRQIHEGRHHGLDREHGVLRSGRRQEKFIDGEPAIRHSTGRDIRHLALKVHEIDGVQVLVVQADPFMQGGELEGQCPGIRWIRFADGMEHREARSRDKAQRGNHMAPRVRLGFVGQD